MNEAINPLRSTCHAGSQARQQKDFTALSVTAEHWLPMEEVPEARLSEYLQQLRRQGYRLVGVEQTAESENLLDVQFTERTALVLGREKEGIPADYLGLLDGCVEIPQFGVTRYDGHRRL